MDFLRTLFRKPRLARQPAKPVWPKTTPIDKSNPCWGFNNNLNVNGIPYKKEEVAPGEWEWVVDEKSHRRALERAQRRRDLFWALRTRVLTDEEFVEAQSHGEYLNIEPMVSFRADEKARELNDAYVTQAKLRAIAAGAG